MGGKGCAPCFDLDENDELPPRRFHDEIDLTAVIWAVVSEEESVSLAAEVAFGDFFAESSGFDGRALRWSRFIPSEELADELEQTRGDGWGRGRSVEAVRGEGRCRSLYGLRMRIGGTVHRVPSSAYRARLWRGC